MRLTKPEGNVISKAPKKDIPKRRSATKNSKLNVALLAASLSAEAPKIRVIAKPSAT